MYCLNSIPVTQTLVIILTFLVYHCLNDDSFFGNQPTVVFSPCVILIAERTQIPPGKRRRFTRPCFILRFLSIKRAENMSYRADIIIIGAGVIGLAIAAQLAGEDREIYVLEKNGTFGQETSSRHSGVIHSGIYYTEG